MKWSEYIANVAKEEHSIKSIILEYEGQKTIIPEIIRTSVLLLDKMIKHQGKYNVIVFPEIKETAFLFTITKLIFNIQSGKITGKYDPYSFTPGQKLKLGNSVVLFEGIVKGKEVNRHSPNIADDEPFIKVTTKDHVFYFLKLECAPYFQFVDNSRSLSTDKTFSKAKKKAGFSDSGEIGIIDKLQQLKTHYDGTVFFVTSVDRAKKYAEDTFLNGKSIKEIFYIASVNYSGEVVNIVSGKLKGIPALTLTYHIDNILVAMEGGLPVQSVIIDLSSINVESQTDALDDLMKKGIPVVCLTDTSNSFETELLSERSFNFWRWNQNSLTSELASYRDISSNRKAFNCFYEHILYLTAESDDINRAFRMISDHRNEVDELPSKCEKLFRVLIRLAYKSLRSVEVYGKVYLQTALSDLQMCKETLEEEKKYIPELLYCDYLSAIEIYKYIFSSGYVFPKITMLESYLIANRPYSITMVVSKDSDKESVHDQWKKRLHRYGYAPYLDVMYPDEYIRDISNSTTMTVIVGWFNKKTIRNIIYSYNSDMYIVLLYESERRWKKYHTREWKRELDDKCNQRAIEQSFEPSERGRKKKIVIQTISEDVAEEDEPKQDEQENIDLVLQHGIYSRYAAQDQHTGKNEDATTVYPVVFNGGYFSLNTEMHKSIVVTDIIEGRSENIKLTDVKGLKTGDLVVVRESSKDIVREVADTILKESNLGDQRTISSKWKQALLTLKMFYDTETIIDSLQNAGCKKDRLTIKNWITNDDRIIPRSREDLEIIAKVTKDKYLSNNLDDVINAGRIVIRAHIKAGRNLSVLLRKKISDILVDGSSIGVFNSWDPVELQIDNIGNVKVLRIIEIGSPIVVSSMYTNRLLSEESEASTWL